MPPSCEHVIRVVWLYIRVPMDAKRGSTFNVWSLTSNTLRAWQDTHSLHQRLFKISSSKQRQQDSAPMSVPLSPTISASSLDSPKTNPARHLGVPPPMRRRLSPSQTSALVSVFEVKTHPSREERALLAAELGMYAHILISSSMPTRAKAVPMQGAQGGQRLVPKQASQLEEDVVLHLWMVEGLVAGEQARPSSRRPTRAAAERLCHIP